MRKLASVMDSKLADWGSMEELPVSGARWTGAIFALWEKNLLLTCYLVQTQVEIPIAKELRFHNVFSCPVSKEESTSENPPMLLKCGHVICRSCVNRFSFQKTRFVLTR